MKALANLVRLSILSSGSRPEGSAPTRILFTSSIAVAGRFPDLNPKGPLEVPEVALEAINSAEFGYPEAKWVCEALLVAAEELYGDGSSEGEPLMHGSIVRIGQMTGPEGSGAWNESEHFPIIVSTSQRLRALPAIDGVSPSIHQSNAAELTKIIVPLLASCQPCRRCHCRTSLLRRLQAILSYGEPLAAIVERASTQACLHPRRTRWSASCCSLLRLARSRSRPRRGSRAQPSVQDTRFLGKQLREDGHGICYAEDGEYPVGFAYDGKEYVIRYETFRGVHQLLEGCRRNAVTMNFIRRWLYVQPLVLVRLLF